MISMHVHHAVITAALVLGVGFVLGIIIAELADALPKRRRPMASYLPAPRADRVVRADPYYTSPGRGR